MASLLLAERNHAFPLGNIKVGTPPGGTSGAPSRRATGSQKLPQGLRGASGFRISRRARFASEKLP